MIAKHVKRVTVTQDTVATVIGAINELVGKQILVGFPEKTTERQDEDQGEMNNAILGYIHEHGAPKANIPARPFLVPGVQDAIESSGNYLTKAAAETLKGDAKKADAYLHDAGIVAMNSARRKINYGDFAPLSPYTIRNRHRNRGTKSMRDSEKRYLEMIAEGSSPEAAQAATGIRPLVNTAQMRNAITYVVRKK